MSNESSGVYGNFLRESLRQAGINPDELEKAVAVKEDFSKLCKF